jgi:hypothetical protein
MVAKCCYTITGNCTGTGSFRALFAVVVQLPQEGWRYPSGAPRVSNNLTVRCREGRPLAAGQVVLTCTESVVPAPGAEGCPSKPACVHCWWVQALVLAGAQASGIVVWVIATLLRVLMTARVVVCGAAKSSRLRLGVVAPVCGSQPLHECVTAASAGVRWSCAPCQSTLP